jgi:hypothetical protein
MLHNNQIVELILKSLSVEATQEEEAQLQGWVNSDPKHSALLLRFRNREWLIHQLSELELLREEQAKEKVWARWQHQ